jgi:hypothetical protein
MVQNYRVLISNGHLEQHPGEPPPLVYSLVIYTGAGAWSAKRTVVELYGEQAALAQKLLIEPYQLIDVARISDDILQQHERFGLVAFALKHRKNPDFRSVIDCFLPWLERVASKVGDLSLGKIVLNYVFNGLEQGNKRYLVKQADRFLSEKTKGELMTIAEQLIRQGRKEGLSKGLSKGIAKGRAEGRAQAEEEFKQKILKKCMSQGLSESMICRLLEISASELNALLTEMVA